MFVIVPKLSFIPSGSIQGGRFTQFAPPQAGQSYAAGLDFSYGLADGDYDACVILDTEGTQVAQMVGRWGDSFYDVLSPVLRYYDPFIVGERQVGLPTLRRLYDAGGHWLYFHRDDARRGRPMRDALGHHASRGDLVLPHLRAAISPRDEMGGLLRPLITIRDAELYDQMCKFGWFLPKGADLSSVDDRDRKASAPPGEHDDLVMGLAYAWQAVQYLPQFERPKPVCKPGSFGQITGHDDVFTPAAKSGSALSRRSF